MCKSTITLTFTGSMNKYSTLTKIVISFGVGFISYISALFLNVIVYTIFEYDIIYRDSILLGSVIFSVSIFALSYVGENNYIKDNKELS